MVIATIFIALNWLSLIAFIVKRQQGGFSFAPPFFCGILGAICSAYVFERHTIWIAASFLLLDPSIGFVLGAIAIKKLRQ
ncbi:hypothetical protein LP420_38740 [Massilia sp. B-10]|nr:hypothetical protein LP420_38740 [Massilia sp. B-10]UUZ54167.1 hypothetical protein LP419_38190 [Massilia sp. H-1]